MPGEVLMVAEGLTRSYAGVSAVRDFTAAVYSGEIVALVGPNGCGKTTSVEMVLGLRHADAGRSEVLGIDPRCGSREISHQLGIALQGAALHARVRLGEQMQYLEALYGTGGAGAQMVNLLGLDGALNKQFGSMSGGMQRRALVATVLAGMPKFSVLDEPTSGVDLESRLQLWSTIRFLVSEKSAGMLVTTHDLIEAEQQADRVIIMRNGVVAAIGTPKELIEASGLGLIAAFRGDMAGLPKVPSGARVLHASGSSVIVGFSVAQDAHEWVNAGPELGGNSRVAIRLPTLEDAYLAGGEGLE